MIVVKINSDIKRQNLYLFEIYLLTDPFTPRAVGLQANSYTG